MSTQAQAASEKQPWYTDWRKVAAVVVPVVLLLVYWSSFSGLVSGEENTKVTAAQVQNQMQRQADLIPNIVATVKAEANFETTTLTGVINARAAAVRPIQLSDGSSCAPVRDGASPTAKPCDPNKLTDDPAAQRAFAEAQRAMLSINVNALREAYPTLQANKGFRDLTAELAGSQNRIAVARRDNQIAVQSI